MFGKKLFIAASEEVKEILHLPLVQRIRHIKARRPLLAIGLGTLVMFSGSGLAASAHALVEYGIPHIVVETLGFTVHGIGMTPILRYIDPVWTLFFGEQIKEAEEIIMAELAE